MEYFDKEGNSITYHQWSELFNDDDYRRIAWTRLHTGTIISTVWLGTAVVYGPQGPQIFETLVRTSDNQEELYKYTTLEQAKAYHEELISIHTHNEKPPTRWQNILDEIE